MAQRNNSRALGSLGVDSQTQQRARPRRASSRRRRHRRATRESRVEGGPRTFQVYKYSSRAPPVSMGRNRGSSSGPSQTPALPDDGNIMGMMARSASYWVRQEPPRCWIRDCACARSGTPGVGCHVESHLLPQDVSDEEDSPTSLRREQLFSIDDDDDDGSLGGTWRAISWADLRSDDGPRSFAEEYALVPLSRRKQYSAQTFHDAVERFLRGF